MGVDHRPKPEVGRKLVVVLGATEWEDEAVVEAALGLLRVGLGPLAVLHAHRPGAEQLAGSAALRMGLPVYALPPDPDSARLHVARQRTRRLVSGQEPDHALLFEGPGWGGGEVRDYMEALETRSFRVRYVSRVPWPGELRWLGESMRQWEANREDRWERNRPIPSRGPLTDAQLADALRSRDPKWIVALVDECRRSRAR